MYYITLGHGYDYETQTIIQVFCPNDRYIKTNEPPCNGLCVLSKISGKACTALIYNNGSIVSSAESAAIGGRDIAKEQKRLVKITIYRAFINIGHGHQPWGILTGIRPAKTVHDLWKRGFSDEQAKQELLNEYCITPEKASLCMSVAKSEKNILSRSTGNIADKSSNISLYIGVPFCPTRCLYCSFTSFPVGKYLKRMPEYFEAMEKEIKLLGGYAKKHRIESIYIGGGTPTALPDTFLERLLFAVSTNFDTSSVKEFTVEAGRPDTITVEKLKLLKKYKAGRISVNPQTMNDKTLKFIGRAHTAADFLYAYETARNEGFDNINVDLILGLPNESVSDVSNTFEQIAQISPNALTVHTIAVKRASGLNQNLMGYRLVTKNEMEQMLNTASTYCKNMNLLPYYMYKQKNMIGNFENVGYCAKGFECIYNVQIMEEKQTIIAAGAGSVTKIVSSGGDVIKRVFDVKGIEEYIVRIDELLQRKIKEGVC